MSQITGNTNLVGGSTAQVSGQTDAFASLDTQAFLELMIAELQNQDPLDPADNEQLLNQIYQIRQIESNDALTETLDAVLLGQNVSSATNLIGADVVGLSDDGRRVSGNVRKVTINDGEPELEVAVESAVSKGDSEGSIGEGRYVYEVVWNVGEDGTQFSIELPADTDNFEEFAGSIRLENLPETSSIKRIYRTDSSGAGARRYVGQISGGTTSIVDTASDSQLGDEFTGTPQSVTFAKSETVRLSTIAEITPPE
ncbi:MAG: flagellar hook capping FlgD N-terminal domain-containing protein [Planctomycetota bacterium]